MIISELVHSVTLCLMRIGSTIVYVAYVQRSMEYMLIVQTMAVHVIQGKAL